MILPVENSRYLVSYDVMDNRRRLRIARLLEGYGHRVQKSVFECTLRESGLADMIRRAERIVEPAEDNIRFYRICNRCLGQVIVMGKELPEVVCEDGLLIV